MLKLGISTSRFLPKPVYDLTFSRTIKRTICSMKSARFVCNGEIVDGLVEALMCFGACSCTIEDAKPTEYSEGVFDIGPVTRQAGKREFWDQSHIVALFAADADVAQSLAFAADSIGLIEVPPFQLEEVDDANWVQQIRDIFKPSKVADRLWIVPKWSTPPDPSAINIILEPGLAFGTGEHPTTKLCLNWLYGTIKGGEHVLDYGTGSGILAITALKMGAKRAVGLDIDPVAVSSSSYNATLNNLDIETLTTFVISFEDDPLPFNHGTFDVVVANILLNPLLQLSERITSYAKPGGRVALSGIITKQVQQVVDTYLSFLENIEVVEDGGWACIHGRKKLQ